MEKSPIARVETFFWRLLLFSLLFASCAGGCTACAVRTVWNDGTPMPLPCGSQNIHGQKGSCCG